MKLQKTNHSYYCSNSNYYVGGHENFGRSDYETWNEFKEEWLSSDGSIDDDYNHLFRFDIEEDEDENEIPNGKYSLSLYFILQRKGIFRPVFISSITEKDMPEIKDFLSKRWDYLKRQWIELSE